MNLSIIFFKKNPGTDPLDVEHMFRKVAGIIMMCVNVLETMD